MPGHRRNDIQTPNQEMVNRIAFSSQHTQDTKNDVRSVLGHCLQTMGSSLVYAVPSVYYLLL